MSAHNINGGDLGKWSEASIDFGNRLMEIANDDLELANMIVQVAMNIIGNAAFRNGSDIEDVLARVVPTAFWQLQQMKDARREAEDAATKKARIN